MQQTSKLKTALLYTCLILVAFVAGLILNLHGFVFGPHRIQVDYTSKIFVDEIREKNPHHVVPNIVHFIWFADSPKDLNFVNYISMLSAYKTQKPDQLILHCDILPSGQWWQKAWTEIPFTIKKLRRPTTVFGQLILHKYHQSDVSRLDILIKYGGIYLDFDVILVNSLNPLRGYNVTLGKEKGDKLNFGIILATPNAAYLTILKSSYRDNYRAVDWDYNSARIPFKIYQTMPHLVHVEPAKLTTPDWKNRQDLWERSIDWSDLYSIHIMGHMDWVEHTPETIKTSRCTFGEVMRFFYYGSSDLITT